MKRNGGKIIVHFGAAILMLGCLSIFQGIRPAAAATGPTYTVAATAAGGVYSRNTPHTADTPRVPGQGVYPGDVLILECGITDGDPIGPYNNHTWYYAHNNSRTEPDFWVNDRYMDTPNRANELAPSVPVCPNESQNPLQSTGDQQSTSHLPCTPLLIVGVRGSGHDYQKDSSGLWGLDGTLSPLVNGLLGYYGKANVTTYGLPYPADPVDPSKHLDNIRFSDGYRLSVKYGVEDLIATVTTQVQACSFQLIDLVGYSQGADVVNNAIPLLPRQIRDHINGVVTFGDPQFGGRNTEDRGSYNPADNGLRATLSDGPRPELPTDMLAKARSYCDDTDYICNISLKSFYAGNSGHSAYVQTHVPEAERFLESLTIVYTGNF